MKEIEALKENIKLVPEQSGVYLFKNGDGVLYVGKAKNLKARLSSYFSKAIEGKTAKMIKKADRISYYEVANEFEALLLEANLVRKLKPKYNIELKDDKSPLYIAITDEEYPRVLTLRQTQLEKYKTKHVFGPYVNSSAPKSLLRKIRKAIPYATHKPGRRPCVLNEIGLCDPCPSDIQTPEQKKEYKKNITRLKNVLSGKINQVKTSLNKEMSQYAKDEQFEKAAKIREQIKTLHYLTGQTTKPASYVKNPNLLSDIRQKELKELKLYISKYIKLEKLKRIECYDVAHLAGTYPTASMVTFVNGEPDKNYYRQFSIKQEKSQDDLSSMKEVLNRRKKHFTDWGMPDLVIIDGGKGQLSVAKEILDIPLVGLAKRFETLVFLDKEGYHEKRLPSGPARNLVQRMRDEAHRFARRHHHRLVSKALKENKQ